MTVVHVIVATEDVFGNNILVMILLYYLDGLECNLYYRILYKNHDIILFEDIESKINF